MNLFLVKELWQYGNSHISFILDKAQVTEWKEIVVVVLISRG